MQPLALRVLGGFALAPAGGSERLRLAPQQAALLVYLALARPHGHRTRDQITSVLWPELPDARARDALNQALFRLREVLGHEAVIREGDEFRLSQTRCDAVEFEALLAGQQREAALDLYAGDLLAGVYLATSGEFERWVDEERERLRSRAVAAAVELAGQAETGGNPAGAAARFRQALGWAPYDEKLVRDSLRVLTLLGDRSGGLALYEKYSSRLAADLQLVPSAELRAAADRLRESPRSVAGVAPIQGLEAQPEAVSPVSTVSKTEGPRRFRVRLGAAFLAFLVALAAFFLTPGLRGRFGGDGSAAPGDVSAFRPNRVVVIPPSNPGGDSVVGVASRMAADWITHQLQRTGLVEVVDAASAAHLIGEASQGLATVARAVQAATVVWGSADRQGDSIAFRLRVIDAREGTVRGVLDPVLAPARDPTVVLPLLAERVAGALAAIQDERLASLTTPASRPPTFAAYQEYLKGLDQYLRPSRREAVAHFHRTLELDSTFVLARFWIVRALQTSGQPTAYDSAVRTLASLRDQLAPAERAAVDMFSRELARDWEGAHQAGREAARLAPHSMYSYHAAQIALWRLDRPAEALRDLATLDPTRGWLKGWPGYWEARLWAYHRAGDYRGELEAARLGLTLLRSDQSYGVRQAELRALLGLGRLAEFRERLTASVDTLTIVDNGRLPYFYYTIAPELRTHGFPDDARAAFERCAAAAGERREPVELGALARCLYEGSKWDIACPMVDSMVRSGTSGHGLLETWWFVRQGVCAAQRSRRAEAQLVFDSTTARLGREGTVWEAELVRLAYLLGHRDRAAALLRRTQDSPGALARLLHVTADLSSIDDPDLSRLIWPAGNNR